MAKDDEKNDGDLLSPRLRTSTDNKTMTLDPALSEATTVKPLGVVFDIDGTLISQSKRDLYCGIRIRPGAIDFLQWLKKRGHAVGIWTKATPHWANAVVQKICPLVSGMHDCSGIKCRKTFDFVWCHDKCKKIKQPPLYWQSKCAIGEADIDNCKWCEVYGSTCHQCECPWDVGECPCRYTKDLRKVYGYPTDTFRRDAETSRFTRERTLIIEDTPQNCRYNYGNAIYVPTYTGGGRHLSTDVVFERIQNFFEKELEICLDVRFVQKCKHGRRYHACYQQSWLIADDRLVQTKIDEP